MNHQAAPSRLERCLSAIVDDWLVVATTLGGIGIVVGVFLPWIRPDPAREVIRFVYMPGMSSGLEVNLTFVLLLLIVVSVATSVLQGRSRFTSGVLVLTGLSSIALPAYYLIDIYIVYSGEFIPHIGSLLTILAGTVLFIVNFSSAVLLQ